MCCCDVCVASSISWWMTNTTDNIAISSSRCSLQHAGCPCPALCNPALPCCSTTVDPTTTRQLAAAAGMLRLHDKAAFPEGYTLRDGKPHLLDAPVSGGVVAAGESP